MRQVNNAESSGAARRSLERKIFQVISYQERPARTLAQQAGFRLGQHFYRALWDLRACGLVVRGRRGWRLAEV